MIIGSGGGGRKSSIGGGPKSKSGNASSSGRQRSLGGAGPRPVEVKTVTLALHQMASSSQARLLSYSFTLTHSLHPRHNSADFFPDGSGRFCSNYSRDAEADGVNGIRAQDAAHEGHAV